MDGPTRFTGKTTADLFDVAATMTLDPGAELVGQVLLAAGATLTGTGKVTGDVTNASLLKPGQSPGLLTIDGMYEQLELGTLEIELGEVLATSTLVHDVLAVSGVAELAGTLEIVVDLLTEGLNTAFDPTAASPETLSFVFLTAAGGIIGDFTNVISEPLNGGWEWRVDRTATTLGLSLVPQGTTQFLAAVVPEPSTALLLLVGLAALSSHRRHAPGRD